MAGKKFTELPAQDFAQIGDYMVGFRGSTDYAMAFPSTGIKDGNGNFLVRWNTVGAASTDYMQFYNGEDGIPPAINLLGDSTNIGLTVNLKGTGLMNVSGQFTVNGSTSINSIINDDTMATAAATNVPTSQSVVNYIGAQVPALTQAFFNGSALDGTVFTVSSDGATITATLDSPIPSDPIILFFNSSPYSYSTPGTVTLTAGTDTNPVVNYVYIPVSTKTLTASTAGWPNEEHAPVGEVVCQSAASLQTQGAYGLRVWTDHIYDSVNQGHLSDINYWIRQQNATWLSGVALTPTAGASTLDVATTSGVVLQLHEHPFPAFDTGAGDYVLVVNDSVTPYDEVSDLSTLLTDATGASMANRYYNLVIWGVASEDSADCKLMVNLPTGSYGTSASAVSDTDRYSVFTIPGAFKGLGFLIARLTIHNTGSNFTIENNEDLRNLTPNTATGSGIGGITAVVDDPAPQLGGNLDVNGFDIVSVSNGDIDITPNGTGALNLDGVNWKGLSNGELFIGDGSGAPAVSTLTAGAGIDVTNGAGSITISSTGGGFTWTEVTGTSQAISVANGYVANNGALVTFTLPAVANVGDSFAIINKGAGFFRIAQGAGQTIHVGASASTTGAGGYIEATALYDSIVLTCTTANTDFAALSGPQGTFTIV